MFSLLRAARSTGLDRALACTEVFTLGGLHSLSLGIRHLRGGQPSAYWIEAAFEEVFKKSIGLPTYPVVRRTNFRDDSEVQAVWDWVQSTSVARRLNAPYLDEQLWCVTPENRGVAEALTANLEDAQNTLAGPVLSIRVDLWEDDRTFSRGVNVVADFAGRPGGNRHAQAILYGGEDRPEVLTDVEEWVSLNRPRVP